MDVIILCHTEFGFVYDKRIIYEKNATIGVSKGVPNLVQLAKKHNAKLTFAIMPEVTRFFPKDIKHEIGLHIHPGWVKWNTDEKFQWYVGDLYLKEHCNLSVNSTVLGDYPYKEQLEMIKIGKEYVEDELGSEPESFVAGRWSINNDTVRALIQSGITHECSSLPHSNPGHYDWSKLPRICMPYHPSETDYQQKGNLSLLMVPISKMFRIGVVNPEFAPMVGLPWLKACFLEYYKQDLPLFHICLHSPSMVDNYYISVMDNFLEFISRHKNVDFRFAHEIAEYDDVNPKTDVVPYLFKLNKNIIKTFLESTKSRTFRGLK
jgi:hypothetical protein